MSNTAVITDPSKNNMDGTSEVSAHPPLTSIAGHFDWSNQHIKKVAVDWWTHGRWVADIGANVISPEKYKTRL